MVGTQIGPGVGAEAKARVLEAVLGSETFARSERLKSLLRFLCEVEIDGREHELTEYTIGTMALGRPPDFAPLEDSSVRSRVHELRQRLEKYYAQEAPAAAIRIELRKGSYVPRFCPVSAAVAPTVQPAHDPAPNRLAWTGVAWTAVAWIAASCFLLGTALTFAGIAAWSALARPGLRLPATRLETASNNLWTPELEALWRPFTASGTPLTIAFESRFFVRMGPLMVRDWHVNTPDEVQTSEPLSRVQRLFDIGRTGNRDYTDGGTPHAIFNLTRLLSSRIPGMALKNSLDVTAADLRDNNLILVGKPSMDPEIERMLSRGDLVDRRGKIVNVHPRTGESAEYIDQSDPSNPDRWGQKYSVITIMPGLGNGKKIMALTASGSEQPAALAFFVTNPESARELVKRLQTAEGKLPEFFQILIRAEYKSKAVVKVDYVTYRPLKVR